MSHASHTSHQPIAKREARTTKHTALTAMRKARSESQVLLTIDAGSCHGISKLENVPRVLRVPHVPPANGKARSRTPATTKPFALTAMCKARAERQRLLTIGASNKLAPILEMNRIDN